MLNAITLKLRSKKSCEAKRQRLQEPLFPSYIFIAIEPEKGPSFTTIRSTRGVVDFVRFGAQPYKVPKSLIEHLQSHQIDESDYSNTPESGQMVHITSGQFSGFDAIYQEADGEKRSILLITLINQKVKVKIKNTDVDW